MIDALMIVRRTMRSAADKWIARHCSPRLVCAPITLESFLVIEFRKSADATVFAMVALGRGWEVDGLQAFVLGDAIDLAEELDWSRTLTRQCDMEGRVQLRTYTLSQYEFDTKANYLTFCNKFGAETVSMRVK